MSSPTPLEQQQLAEIQRQQQQLQQQQQLLQQQQTQIARLTAAAAAVAPPASSSSPTAAPTRAGDLKPLQPSPFTGAPGHASAEQWLLEIVRYFAAVGRQPDQSAIVFVSTFLKDSASTWYNCLTANPATRPNTWDEFTRAFRSRFNPLAASRTARSALRDLRHKGNVAAYSDAFLGYLQHIPDMSAADQVDQFINGLPASLANEVDRLDPDSLDKAMDFAQREELRQLSTSRRDRPAFYHGDRRTNFIPHYRAHSFYAPSSSSPAPPASDPVPHADGMDLSLLHHSSWTSEPFHGDVTFASPHWDSSAYSSDYSSSDHSLAAEPYHSSAMAAPPRRSHPDRSWPPQLPRSYGDSNNSYHINTRARSSRSDY